ncbi:tellurite resistance protein permease [Dietzia cinnamea]|uniref:tellurite resistance/C4-dicarboxylate transporter family protein n=1 Tax=Dietzia massiliensis TaxID=2697499 RepID=UPI0007C69A10|nr:tellurite resistance/C4-dicarboxylate transporter family protein [Dietzia massiliensis]MBS7546851.1 tellurite resistance/C4-dicarboxylate transporter family protein [Dietzia massiliensis]OAH47544.1 tellurite resistance protein permease [Dietzia cinnamea]
MRPHTLPTPARLSPGYFAMVMATGIVAVGAGQRGWQTLSVLLTVLTAVEYAVLVLLTLWRLIAYRTEVVSDLHDSRKAFLFFTFVAGTNVLAVALAGHGLLAVPAALLCVAAVAWIILGYTVPWVAVLSRDERPVVAEANGTWFIWVVASQSVAVAAATLEPRVESARDALAIVAVTSWSVGVVLYVASAVFVSLRLMLYPLDPTELDPPYWVSMGAVAITVVAGARIVEMASAPMVDAVRGLVAGLVVVFWCFATWLIPVLVAVGVWRHKVRQVPFHFEPTWWSIVFPLGMYAVAGMYLGRADDLPIVAWIGEAWMWVAVAAWLIAVVGMVRSRLPQVATAST